MVRVVTLHLEHQYSHAIWLHTVGDLLKEMVSLDLWVQEQRTEQELAQAEEDKVNGRTHGVLAEVAVALVAQDLLEEDKVVEIISVLQEKAHLKTQVQAEDAVETADLEFA